ncbi:MAG TPA: hypothetical protein VMT03_12480 [Polyangia bacterium]|nr:hypothetical protein [Polyangia bacterium]
MGRRRDGTRQNGRPNPWPALLHPLPIAAIALTALNDHLPEPSGGRTMSGDRPPS